MEEPATNANADQRELPAARRSTWRRLLTFAILALVPVVVACRPDSFVCGLLGESAWTFYLAIFPGIYVALVAFGYLLFRLVQKLLRWRTLRFWTKLTYICFVICSYYLSPVGLDSHRLGFYYWAKSHVDVPAGVQWAEAYQLTPEEANQTTDRVRVRIDCLPPSIQALEAQSSMPRFYYEKRAKTLVIVWGSSMMGSWGVTIGRGIGNKEARDNAWKVNDDAYSWTHTD